MVVEQRRGRNHGRSRDAIVVNDDRHCWPRRLS
jgi:hypothetical protein